MATLAALALHAFSASAGNPTIAAICDSAATVAARESGVPLDVLRAISLTETGRQQGKAFRPWPWTVNMEGVGKWFDDLATARRYVDANFQRGARSFDIGCFQINFKWHGDAFASIDDMFDPLTNARYAARFLSELYDEFHDWSKAAGAYHSRTPKHATRYAARFDRIRARLPVAAAAPVAPSDVQIASSKEPGPRRNSYPFFLPGMRSGGSLVPLENDAPYLIALGERRPFLELR